MNKLLVAGIGNVFLGDDGFGVEVVRRLSARPLPEDVEVADYGIRGFDLAYALMDEYRAAVLVDALPHGCEPGSLALMEPDFDSLDAPGVIEGHGMNPVEVLRLVKQLGGRPPRLFLVGCEPETFGPEEEGMMGLSAPVEAAVDEAVSMVESLVRQLHQDEARKQVNS